jgi:hypothetical protein
MLGSHLYLRLVTECSRRVQFFLSSSAKCGRVAEFSWVSVPGEPYESVSPLVKAILAVTAGGERYRLGHYGAITKVPRGNVAGKGMLRSANRESYRRRNGRHSLPICLCRKHRYRDSARLEGTGAGGVSIPGGGAFCRWYTQARQSAGGENTMGWKYAPPNRV